jgi:hypothetical protein
MGDKKTPARCRAGEKKEKNNAFYCSAPDLTLFLFKIKFF